MKIENLRREYRHARLLRKDLPKDPMVLFQDWLSNAIEAQLCEPNAMVLGTWDKNDGVRLRNVLLKGINNRSVVFYTNYKSGKAEAIDSYPQVSLLFSWLDLERQVEIQGVAKKADRNDSEQYFHSRPRKSQLGAWVSQQSKIITSRKVLEKKMSEIEESYEGKEVPLPDFWGGYLVSPLSIEFWQGRESRLHDRFLYQRISLKENNWEVNRLSP